VDGKLLLGTRKAVCTSETVADVFEQLEASRKMYESVYLINTPAYLSLHTLKSPQFCNSWKYGQCCRSFYIFFSKLLTEWPPDVHVWPAVKHPYVYFFLPLWLSAHTFCDPHMMSSINQLCKSDNCIWMTRYSALSWHSRMYHLSHGPLNHSPHFPWEGSVLRWLLFVD
jgi:hypothetical protein